MTSVAATVLHVGYLLFLFSCLNTLSQILVFSEVVLFLLENLSQNKSFKKG